MLMEQIFVKWTCPRRVPSTVPGAPESSCFVCYAVFLGAQGRAFRVVTIYSAPQAINASGGFARCEYASQIRLGRVKIHCISLNWRAYSLRRQSNHHVREREPSTHTPILCPVPIPTRLSHANAACGQTQRPACLLYTSPSPRD